MNSFCGWRIVVRCLCRGLATCKGSSCCTFRVPKRGHGVRLVETELPCGVSVARVSKFSSLRRTRKLLGRLRRGTTEMFRTRRARCLIGKDAIKLLDTIVKYARHNNEVLVTEGYRGSMCGTMCVGRLHPMCVCPRFSRRASLGNRVRMSRVGGLLRRCRSVRTIIVISPACRKIISSVRTVTRVIRRCGVPLVISRTRNTRFKFRSCFPRGTGAQNTSIIVRDLRGALPSLARATLLRVGKECTSHREVEGCLRVLRSDDPSCVLVTSVSRYIQTVSRHERRVVSACIRYLRRTERELGRLGGVGLVRTRRCSQSGVMLSMGGLGGASERILGKGQFRRVLESCRLRVRVTSKSCIVTVAKPKSARRKVSELIRTIVRVSGGVLYRRLSKGSRSRVVGGVSCRVVPLRRTCSSFRTKEVRNRDIG